MKIQEALARITTELSEQEARFLVAALTKMSHAELLTSHRELTTQEESTLKRWLFEITQQHKPLAYVLGTVPFLQLELCIEPPILIPRPETESWCAQLIEALKKLQKPFSLLDMCTGSGCIALAVAQVFPHDTIVAVDKNPHALALAAQNAQHNNIHTVTFVESDLYTKLPERSFDYIVANPPYISETEFQQLDESVTRWEDRQALVARDGGYALIEQIIAQAPCFLKKGGQLWIEIGYQQADKTKELFRRYGFTVTESLFDVQGHERVIRASVC